MYCLGVETMVHELVRWLKVVVLMGALVGRASVLRAVPGTPALVLYGSQTGTAEDIALGICRSAVRLGVAPRCMPMDAYDASELPNEALVIYVASTTGDGEAPISMRRFWATLRRRDLPAGALHKVRYAVFGCGDSSYPKFNAVARRLDMRMRQLGASQLVPCGLGDDQAAAGVDAALETWIPALFQALSLPVCSDGPGRTRLPASFFGGGGAGRLELCFREGAVNAVLPRRKHVAAIRTLACGHDLVLFSRVIILLARASPHGTWGRVPRRLLRDARSASLNGRARPLWGELARASAI